ncbi:aldo/keto reductase [Hamadaea tsunoensis]|uniref:aldo/keto reductase n=1 Tax=Hamadaea tsunoensis TaxID=53368 RepID=UPI00048A40FD|nr:aldo/keto reductase [Hamadaea tsunoensis]
MQTVTLNNGTVMPQLGFGVWQVPDDEAYKAVTAALAAGYRSIDTAKLYFNEEGVGRALAESGVPRADLFVTTKLWNDEHDYDKALRAFDTSLAKLGLDYVDLYLIHWPVPKQDRYLDAWKALQKVYADGRAKAIGVSNFRVADLDRVLAGADVAPAVNQIELHPRFSQPELRAYHARHGIHTEAWSPLGQGKGLLDDPVLAKIAAAHDRTPAQVVLRWHLQLGNIVIPKSVTPARIAENFDVFDFTLSDDEVAEITAMDRGAGGRIGNDPATMNWMG